MKKAYTNVTEWLLAMRNFADSSPDLLWLSTDPAPYIGYVACDEDDPDPDHVRTFAITLGSVRRILGSAEFTEFAELLRPCLANSHTRARIATDLNDPNHPLVNAMLGSATSQAK